MSARLPASSGGGAFGRFARAWCTRLTQAQRDPWNIAGPKVQSKSRLGSGPLTGQQLFQAICCVRACIGADTDIPSTPPAPVIFGLNPVENLLITNGEDGVRLLLRVVGPVAENIMVFGQAPCSAGRSKRRNVAYLGLLPTLQNGLSDIADNMLSRVGPVSYCRHGSAKLGSLSMMIGSLSFTG
jgi:hypothetical protein